MKRISVVIPVYNSSKSLNIVNKEINKCLDNLAYDYEKIYINDSSTDESLDVLKQIAARPLELKRTKVISLKENSGQQNAIFYALRYVSGDYIVTMDDDLQHNINYLKDMIKKIDEGADLVYGVCEIPKENKSITSILDTSSLYDVIRKKGSSLTAKFFYKNYKNLSGNRVSSFRVFHKKLLPHILKCDYSFIYLSAIMLNYTARVENVVINKRERVFGRSGYNFKKLLILYLKLNFYYSRLSIDPIKPRGIKFEVSELINIFDEVEYEKGNDAWSGKVSS